MKVAAKPAAAPQAKQILPLPVLKLNNLVMNDPIAAPTATTGPSRPTKPPVAMVRPVHKALSRALRGGIFPSHRAADSITSGTPGPRASGARKAITGPTTSPPRTGINIRSHQGAATARAIKSPSPGHNPHCPTSIRAKNPSVPIAAKVPMTIARSKKSSSLVRGLRFMASFRPVSSHNAQPTIAGGSL